MKKLFISQPMKGLTDKQILTVRNEAINLCRNKFGEMEILQSFFQGAPVNAKPMWFLAKSIELLSEADVAYFAKGWESSRGCVIEHMCADKYGVHCIVEEVEK